MNDGGGAAIRDAINQVALLPEGVAGIDAGLTLTKVARCGAGSIELTARETASVLDEHTPSHSIIGDATRIHGRAALSALFRRVELGVAYDAWAFDDADLTSLSVGVGLWF